MRRYLRCREEFYQRIVISIVQGLFAVFLLMFSRTLHRLFQRHAHDLPTWVEIAFQVVLLFVVALIARRTVGNVRDIKELRQEMKQLHEAARNPDEPD